MIPNKGLSVYDDAVAPWRGEKLSEWKNDFIQHTARLDFPLHRPYNELSEEQKDLLWKGTKGVSR